jgi:hypothetical protein
MSYVPTKSEENPFKDERALNHTDAEIEHDNYVSLATCCEVSMFTPNLKLNRPYISEQLITCALAQARSRVCPRCVKISV